jgi:hypothetical protein
MSDVQTDGSTLRRQVMGDEFVDRALADADEFTRPCRISLPPRLGRRRCRAGWT